MAWCRRASVLAFAAVVCAPVAGSCPARVATVVASPPWTTVPAGATVQLTAAPHDATGHRLARPAVTWSSNNTSAAIVSEHGLVTGVAVGRAIITATSEGKSATAAITVGGGSDGPDPSLTNECAAPSPAWIWCDDFEQDRLSRYLEYVDAGSSFVRVAGVGVGGSYGMRARFAAGQVEAGSLQLAMGKVPKSTWRTVDAGTAIYRDVYWRMYVRNQAGWVGGGGYKLSRATVLAGATWAQAMIAHLWGDPPGSNTLQLDPVRLTDAAGNLRATRYNDFAKMTWLGTGHGATPLFDASHVGQWYCVEAHAQLNDAGLANGVFEYWINGALEARQSGLNWLGAFRAYGINAVFFENYNNDGSPAAQERYFDNLVISTQRIGC